MFLLVTLLNEVNWEAVIWWICYVSEHYHLSFFVFFNCFLVMLIFNFYNVLLRLSNLHCCLLAYIYMRAVGIVYSSRLCKYCYPLLVVIFETTHVFYIFQSENSSYVYHVLKNENPTYIVRIENCHYVYHILKNENPTYYILKWITAKDITLNIVTKCNCANTASKCHKQMK